MTEPLRFAIVGMIAQVHARALAELGDSARLRAVVGHNLSTTAALAARYGAVATDDLRDEPEPNRPRPPRLGAHGRLRDDDPAPRPRPRPRATDQGLGQPGAELPRHRGHLPGSRDDPLPDHIPHRAGDRHPRRRAGLAQLKQTLQTVRQNGPLVRLCLSSFFFLTGQNVSPRWASTSPMTSSCGTPAGTGWPAWSPSSPPAR